MFRSHTFERAASRIAAAFALGLLAAGTAGAQEASLPATAAPATPAASAVEPTAPEAPPAPADASQQAAASAEPSAPIKPWTVDCREATDTRPAACQMSQTLVNDQNGQRIISVSIRRQGQGLSMVMALPHGLHLPGGVSYQVDSGRQASIPLEISDDKGVYAIVPIDDTLFSAMKRGNTFTVGVVALNRRQLIIPMTLAGFTAAADEMTN